MTRGGTDRRNTCLRAARGCRRSQLYGDSPASQSFVPITSALFESCSRNPTLAARNGLHHQYAAQQWGSPSGRPWSPGYPGQARARDLAPALCRALMVQAVTIYKKLLSSQTQRLSLGIAGKKLFEHLAECCSGVQLGENR